jgi:hypothetical protein
MLVAFSLDRHLKAPENLGMELLNLQSNANLHQKSSETKLQDFYSYVPKEEFLYSSLLG